LGKTKESEVISMEIISNEIREKLVNISLWSQLDMQFYFGNENLNISRIDKIYLHHSEKWESSRQFLAKMILHCMNGLISLSDLQTIIKTMEKDQ
jgi:hypothetical protein